MTGRHRRAADRPPAGQWRGLNLVGFVLMQVRDIAVCRTAMSRACGFLNGQQAETARLCRAGDRRW